MRRNTRKRSRQKTRTTKGEKEDYHHEEVEDQYEKDH